MGSSIAEAQSELDATLHALEVRSSSGPEATSRLNGSATGSRRARRPFHAEVNIAAHSLRGLFWSRQASDWPSQYSLRCGVSVLPRMATGGGRKVPPSCHCRAKD